MHLPRTTLLITAFLNGYLNLAFSQHQELKEVDPTSLKEISQESIRSEDRVLMLQFSPAGDRIALGGLDAKISCFSVADGQLAWRVEGAEIEPNASTNIPSSDPILITAQNSFASGKILLHNWGSGEPLGNLAPFDGGRSGLDFFGMTGASKFAWAGPEGKIFEFNLAENSVTDGNGWAHHEGKAYAVAYGPYGNVFSAGQDGKVIKREGNGTKTVLTFENPVLSMAINPFIKGTQGNEILVAAGDNDGNLKVTQLQSGETLHTQKLNGDCRLLQFHPTDPDLLVAATKSALHFIDFREGETAHTVTFSDNEVWSLSISNDGTKIALGMDNGDVKIYQF